MTRRRDMRGPRTFFPPLAVLGADPKTVVGAAAAAGDFKTFGKILAAADEVKYLEGKGPFTLFAPTDKAFSKVPKADLDGLLRDRAKAGSFVRGHVTPG